MNRLFPISVSLLVLAALAGCGHKPQTSARYVAPARCVHLECRESDGCYCDPDGQCHHVHSAFNCWALRERSGKR